jgi:hypothetical protein
MNRVFFKRTVLAGLMVGACWSISASARTVVIDNGDTDVPPCAIGGSPCAGLTMPFSADFGVGAFNKIYVYNNGLVSFGSEIAAGANLSSITSIGGNVFTAGYSPSMTLTQPFQLQLPSTASNEIGILKDKPVFRVRYLTSFGAVTGMLMQVSIFDVGGGEYALQFAHGNSGGTPDIAANAYLGYSFGASNFQVSGSTLRTQVQGGATAFEYFFRTATPSVPEPTSWVTMLVGFAIVGGGLRRRRSITLREA